MKATYTEHLKTRMKARKIPEDYPQKIYENPEQKFSDMAEGNKIAIKKLLYNNKVRKSDYMKMKTNAQKNGTSGKKEFQEVRRLVVPVLKKHGVVRAGIFGSYARGEAGKKSDIDILVRFAGRKSLFDLARLEIDVEKKLGRKADVLTYGSVHPLLKERILKEEVKIL